MALSGRFRQTVSSLSRLTVVGLTCAIVVLSAGPTAGAQSVTATPPTSGSPTLRVVVKPVPPFVMQNGTDWTGFSIDLWREIAQRRGWTYALQGVDTVDQQLDAVRTGSADASIAAISVTDDRAQTVDFSYPYFTSGLQVMVASHQPSFLDALISFVTPDLLKLIGIVIVVLILVAHGVWLFERHMDADFPRRYLPGVGEALWWAGVTLTTVGYGDRTPKGRIGRAVAFVWMFAGIFLLANFTAAITARATVQQLQNSISGVDDLRGKQVATVQGSTADQYLASRGLAHRTVTRIEDAYPLVEQGRVQAVLYDAPVLEHYASTDGAGQVQMVGKAVQPEQYAIALPIDSPYRRAIDQTLLQIMADGSYEALYERWFGQSP
ncbi:MAG: transporter substrate-binding domain-containing protein [Chloroflexi bacterium]|nr:transporter substrate-binding domain-containing protein [Chloroflexota bacterium]